MAKKGDKQTSELIKKRVEARKGYKHSEETKRKIGIGNKNKIRSIIIRNKISNALKGSIPWNKNLTKELDKRVDYERPTKFKDKFGNVNPNGRRQEYYRRLIFEGKEEVKCNRCENKARVVHHKNDNFRDNRIENLEPLCQSCHSKEHETWRNFNA